MTTTFAFHGLRRMSLLSLLVAVNAVMLLSCLADAQQNIKRIKMEKENLKEIYLAGGCFWGTEHYLEISTISMTGLCCLNLLFEDKEMVNRIKFHPMALWKSQGVVECFFCKF